MPPFRDAVRFIDGIKRDLYRLQEFNVLLFGDGLRRNLDGTIEVVERLETAFRGTGASPD